MYSRFLIRHVGSCLRSNVLRVTVPHRNLYFMSEGAATRSTLQLPRFSSTSTEAAKDFVVDELQEDDAPGKLLFTSSVSIIVCRSCCVCFEQTNS